MLTDFFVMSAAIYLLALTEKNECPWPPYGMAFEEGDLLRYPCWTLPWLSLKRGCSLFFCVWRVLRWGSDGGGNWA